MSQITEFFAGIGTDAQGRTLAFILAQDNKWWEETHNHIQWLFPTPQASKFNPDAPIATADDYKFLALAPSVKATSALDNVFERFIVFLGIKPFIENHGLAHRNNAPPAWWSKGNHNHLRVSRCLTCLDYIVSPHAMYLACCLRLALRELALKFPDGCSNENLHFWGVRIIGREVNAGGQ